MIIYNCKYMLPCGWCELREMMCTANEPFVIKYRDDKPIVLNCAVECESGWKNQPTLMGKPMYDWCPVCGADMRGEEV